MLVTFKNILFPGHNHHANHQYCWVDMLIITRAPAKPGIDSKKYVPGLWYQQIVQILKLKTLHFYEFSQCNTIPANFAMPFKFKV